MWNAEDRSRIGSIGHEAVQEHTPDRSLCWRALYVTHIDPNYSTRKLTGHATAHTTTNQELVFRPGEGIFTLASLCGTCIICQFWIAKWLVDEQLWTWTTRYVLRTGSRDASSAMKRRNHI